MAETQFFCFVLFCSQKNCKVDKVDVCTGKIFKKKNKLKKGKYLFPLIVFFHDMTEVLYYYEMQHILPFLIQNKKKLENSNDACFSAPSLCFSMPPVWLETDVTDGQMADVQISYKANSLMNI